MRRTLDHLVVKGGVLGIELYSTHLSSMYAWHHLFYLSITVIEYVIIIILICDHAHNWLGTYT